MVAGEPFGLPATFFFAREAAYRRFRLRFAFFSTRHTVTSRSWLAFRHAADMAFLAPGLRPHAVNSRLRASLMVMRGVFLRALRGMEASED